MSKFLKRSSHIITKYETAVVLGRNFSYILDLTEWFDTVFVYDIQRSDVKRKNLIPRIGFTDTKTLPGFNLLAVDELCLWEIATFTPLASLSRAGIILVHNEPIGKKILKHLWQYNYEQVGNYGSANFWKKAD